MKLPYRILVVDDDPDTLSGMVELLRDEGHHVTGAATYDAAKRLLSVGPFDLLIADVRLRSFNGLHLVRSTQPDHPEMGVIIITGYPDPLIDLEAHRYHASLVHKPIRPQDLVRTVSAVLAAVRRQRRWPRKRVIGGFRVTVAGRPAAVVDVSYGGLRLELPEGTRVADPFDVEVAGIGLHLEVERVWSVDSEASGGTICGAALAQEHTPSARTWRAIVDRLTA